MAAVWQFSPVHCWVAGASSVGCDVATVFGAAPSTASANEKTYVAGPTGPVSPTSMLIIWSGGSDTGSGPIAGGTVVSTLYIFALAVAPAPAPEGKVARMKSFAKSEPPQPP